MSELFIRVKKDGTIYPYNEILAKNSGCEVISEEIAFPERFVKPEVIEKVTKTRKKRGYGLDLTTEEVPENTGSANPDIDADASRKLP
jgi:hypothetical protein